MSGDDVTNNHRLLDSRPLSDGDRPLPYLVDTEPDKRHDESNAFPVAASLGLRRVLRKVGVAKEAMWDALAFTEEFYEEIQQVHITQDPDRRGARLLREGHGAPSRSELLCPS